MGYKENVLGLLKSRNLSGPIIAKRMGISPSTFYQSLENPTLSSMERVANALDVPVSLLLEEGMVEVGVMVCPHCGSEVKIYSKK